jgi:hypothetical protein
MVTSCEHVTVLPEMLHALNGVPVRLDGVPDKSVYVVVQAAKAKVPNSIKVITKSEVRKIL